MSQNKYYVYRYIRLDLNIPFYVGKGHGRRAYRLTSHNDLCQSIVNISEVKIEIMLENLSEVDALIKEIELIKMYKNEGYCSANKTSGGQGLSGHAPWNKGKILPKLSEDHKHKLRVSQLGIKSGMLGKKHKYETIEKMKLAHAGSKNGFYNKTHTKETCDQINKNRLIPIIDSNGIVYKSIQEAARTLNIAPSNISALLKGKRKSVKSLIFYKLEKQCQ